MIEDETVPVPPAADAGSPSAGWSSAGTAVPGARGRNLIPSAVTGGLAAPALYACSIAGGLIVWESVARRMPRAILAPPSAVLVHLVRDTRAGELPLAFFHALGALAAGLALAAVVAIPLGFLMGRSELVAEAIDPILNAVYVIPPVAFVPFFIIWFGLFFPARVALVFIMCVFEMLVTVAAGVRDVSPETVEAGRSFGAGRLALIGKVLVPAALPFLFAAFRIGLVRGINAMITAELFFAAVNLGQLMKQTAQNFDTAGLLAVIVVLSGFGLAAQEGLRALEGRMLPWHLRESR